MAIKAVMFDAVGTLIYADPPVARVYHREGRRFGSQLDEQQLHDRLLEIIPLRLYRNEAGNVSHETSQEDLLRRWQQIVRDVFDDLDDTSSIFETLWSHFAQPDHWALFPDVLPTLESLRGAGVGIGVASNFDDRLDRICLDWQLVSAATHVFHSARLGVQKPAVDFFRKIEAEVELRPNELMMVGDDWRDDYQAPRQAGWHACWLRRDAATTDSDELSSLTQLLDVIASCDMA